jgi:hypothetical protein
MTPLSVHSIRFERQEEDIEKCDMQEKPEVIS